MPRIDMSGEVSRTVFYALAVALLIFVYNRLYAFDYFFVTEGWFSAYASLLRSGQIPHRDFPLLLSPFYAGLIAGAQTLFGEGFYALRCIGVAVTVGLSLALFALLRQLFGNAAAAFGAVAGTIYYQSGNAYLGYDFTQFLTLFLLLGGVCFTSAVADELDGKHARGLVLGFGGGACVAVAVLTKHSNGGVAALVIAIALVIASLRAMPLAAVFQYGVAVAFGFACPFALLAAWLVLNGAWTAFLNDMFVEGPAAKGGLGNIFSAWIIGFFTPYASYRFWSFQFLKWSSLVLSASLLLALCTIAISMLKENGPSALSLRAFYATILLKLRNQEASDRWLLPLLLFGFLAVFANVFFQTDAFWTGIQAVYAHAKSVMILGSVNVVLIGLVGSLAAMLVRPTRMVLQSFLMFALASGLVMGNGTSGGLSEISAFMGYALFFSAMLRFVIPFGMGAVPPLLVIAAISSALADLRYGNPYSWWSVKVPDIRTGECADRGGIFAGICISPAQNEKLSAVRAFIEAHSLPGDEIYVFPHLPVLYLDSGRRPFHGAAVSWYDFMSDRQALSLASALRNAPPSVIVFADLPPEVATAHERLFRHSNLSGQREIVRAILEMEAAGTFCETDKVDNLDGMNLKLFARCKS